MSTKQNLALMAGAFGALGLAATAHGALATFDSLEEGFYGELVVDGGITFFDAENLPLPGGTLGVEDATWTYPFVEPFAPFFSSPNVLQMDRPIPGPYAVAARWGDLRMSTGFIENHANVDMFYVVAPDIIGNSIILEAYLRGELVDSTSILLDAAGVYHTALSITDTEFDVLRLTGVGPIEGGVFLGAIDNVLIVPEPTSLVFLAVAGVFQLVRASGRRRRGATTACLSAFFAAGALAGGTLQWAVEAIPEPV